MLGDLTVLPPRVHRIEASTAVCQRVDATVSERFKSLDWDVEWTTTTDILYTHGPAYCFISRDRKQCHPFVTCKDYLGDMTFAVVNKWRMSAGGYFTYSAKSQPRICMSKMRIVFCNPKDKEFVDHIDKCLDLIHQAERDLGLPPTVARKVRNPMKKYNKTGMYFFMGSGAWMSSPVMLSLYTLLIRLGKSHKLGRSWEETVEKVGERSTDDFYDDRLICEDAIHGIRELKDRGWRARLGTDLAKNYPAGIREDVTHSHFGIQAFGAGSVVCKKHCGHWFS